jgi:aldehyde dehydrogenase (NAD+)
MRRAGLLLGGEETVAAAGGTFDVCAPWDGAVVGVAARATAADVTRAVEGAGRAWPRWWALAPGERERPLLAAADALAQTGESRLLELLIDESGSTITKARSELAYTIELLRAAAGEARRLFGETLPHDRPGRLSMVFREPLGVVAAISPFNAPLALFAKMIAFPLAAGNAVVAKPSELTPLVAVELGRILGEAGLPPGVLQVLTGFGPECGEPLVAHPGVAGIAFTGSTATGQRIASRAGARLARLQLELGGKSPLLVLADADVEEAAAIAVAGAFTHAGQICMAASRIVVERPAAARFTEALLARVRALHLGELRDPATAYGPLISRRALEKVERHVAAARAGGARLLTGGSTRRGLVYEPTVLVDPPRDAAIWREETFGPVTSLVIVEDLEAAIAEANDSEYGLSAGVLTRNLGQALICARRLRAGAVHLGAHPFQSNALAPIGGLGLSGLGRSGGRHSVEAFTELKWVTA